MSILVDFQNCRVCVMSNHKVGDESGVPDGAFVDVLDAAHVKHVFDSALFVPTGAHTFTGTVFAHAVDKNVNEMTPGAHVFDNGYFIYRMGFTVSGLVVASVCGELPTPRFLARLGGIERNPIMTDFMAIAPSRECTGRCVVCR